MEVDVGYFFDVSDRSSVGGPMEHGGKDRSTIELVHILSGSGDPALHSAMSGLVRALAGRECGRPG